MTVVTLRKETDEGVVIIDYVNEGLETYEEFLLRVIAELEDELKHNVDAE